MRRRTKLRRRSHLRTAKAECVDIFEPLEGSGTNARLCLLVGEAREILRRIGAAVLPVMRREHDVA
jgi:hypothetical protein